jgi:hypothetical protein
MARWEPVGGGTVEKAFQALCGAELMDVIILLIVTACGAFGAPLQVVILAALVLTAMSARRKFEIARAYPDVGSTRVLASALVLSLANNTVFTLLSFLLGRVVSLRV